MFTGLLIFEQHIITAFWRLIYVAYLSTEFSRNLFSFHLVNYIMINLIGFLHIEI